jgi:hypothetical protein
MGENVENIGNIELTFITVEDFSEVKETMISSYQTMPEAYWRESQIRTLVNIFPEGQVALRVDGKIAGCALSIIVDYNKFDDRHTYREITGNLHLQNAQ